MIPNAMRTGRSRRARSLQSVSCERIQAAVAPAGPPLRRGAEHELIEDYLGHFDRAVMLLQLLAATPDCAGDFHVWRVPSLSEHLATPRSKRSDAALARYWAIDERARIRFEALTDSMRDVLVATQEVMQATPPSPAIGMLANRAALWVGKLAAQARTVIDDPATTPQTGP
jgi:hypothetical protein